MNGTTYLIGNPRSGTGDVPRRWDELVSAAQAHGMTVEPRLTDRPGHAVGIAAEACRNQAELVVAVGGDGTVHEVVNGLLEGAAGADPPPLGIVSLGSGSDYAKTFSVPESPLEALSRTAGAPVRRVDAAEVTFLTAEGEARRWFANIAEAGIGAETVRKAARLPRRLGGLVYGLAFLATLPSFRRPQAEISWDEGSYSGPLTNLVVAVGQVFGGGMRIAPQADPSDGLFDVQIQHGSKLEYVRSLPRVYRGTHLPHPSVLEVRTAGLEVECTPAAPVEADGEILGTTPVTFRCLKGALRLKV